MNKLEERILDSLGAIGYDGPLSNKSEFSLAIENGPKSVEYTQFIHFLTNEIRTLLEIDEEVNAISSPEDSVTFVMEVTSFLKELNCPYKNLTRGHVSDRLQNNMDKLLLFDYLISELMTARILQEKNPSKKIELKLQETDEGKDMRLILQTLRFPKPPSNISLSTLFNKLVPTIDIVFKKAGCDIVGNAIFNGFLSPKQWETLKQVNDDLDKEYKIRREMLLTRLDVTIQSFQWSDKTKGKDELFEKVYQDKRKNLKVDPDVDLADLLAAREELAIIEKTSSANVRKNTRSQLNKVIIGSVPDRGGRTSEIAPPPPEMPSWQQRTAPPSRGGGRGGGYSRGGYQQNQNRNFDSAGSYNTYNRGDNTGGGNYDNRIQDNYNTSGGNNYYDNNRSGSGYDNRGGGGGGGGFYDGGGRRDSGGSYGYQQNKRANTYDSFQAAKKTTYADEYVQEQQHNQQYSSRDDNRGYSGGRGGQSNYHRGRGRGRGSYR